ncbi:MAG: DUF6132 family protein [Elusimicrobiota bacterium]|jgi:hypothetical protein
MNPTIKTVLGILVGGLAGWAWYRFVGCRTGACPLTGNPYLSTLYGAVLGALLTMK